MKFKLLLFVMILSRLGFADNQPKIKPIPNWLMEYEVNNHNDVKLNETQDGYYIKKLSHQFNLDLQENYIDISFKILNSTGVQNVSQQYVSYDPNYEQLIFHKIIVIRNGKEMNQLTEENIKAFPNETDKSNFIYNGSYTSNIVLKDVRVGDEIHLQYTIKGFNPVFKNLFASKIYFERNQYIDQYFFCLIHDDKRTLNFKTFTNFPKITKDKKFNKNLYYYIANKVNPKIHEDATPNWYDPYQYIQFSEFKTWQEVSNWSVQVFNTEKLNDQDVLKDLKEKGEDKKTFALNAIRFVQEEIRYLGYEMGENSHKPHNPNEILKNRFGDCKDKSVLLVELLKANNIEAYPALINTYEKSQIEKYLPSPLIFNHCIVTYFIDKKQYWVDPTFSDQGGNIETMFVPNYEKAFVIRKNEAKLSDIETFNNGKIEITETYDARSFEKASELMVVSNYTGSYADNMRSYFNTRNKETIESNYIDYYASSHPDILLLDDITFDDDRDENRITVFEKYKLPSFWKKDSATLQSQCEVYMRSIYEKFYKIRKLKRIAPIAISHYNNIEHKIVVLLPIEWDIDLKNSNFQTDAFQYISYYHLENNNKELHASFNFTTKKDHLPADQIEKYMAMFKQIEEDSGFTLYGGGIIQETTEGKKSGLVILLFLLITALFIFFAKKFIDYDYRYDPLFLSPKSFSGFIIFIGFILFTKLLSVIYSILIYEGFNKSAWEGALQLIENGNTLFGTSVFIEFFINSFLLVISILSIYLFFNKRNTFPIVFSISLLTTFGIRLLEYLIVDANMDTFSSQEASDTQSTMVSSTIGCLIFVPYLLLSEKVKEVFILPSTKTLKKIKQEQELTKIQE